MCRNIGVALCSRIYLAQPRKWRPAEVEGFVRKGCPHLLLSDSQFLNSLQQGMCVALVKRQSLFNDGSSFVVRVL